MGILHAEALAKNKVISVRVVRMEIEQWVGVKKLGLWVTIHSWQKVDTRVKDRTVLSIHSLEKKSRFKKRILKAGWIDSVSSTPFPFFFWIKRGLRDHFQRYPLSEVPGTTRVIMVVLNEQPELYQMVLGDLQSYTWQCLAL